MPTKTVVAIIAIMILDLAALFLGIDGKYLIIGILAISGLGGYPLLRYLKRQ